jgi:hypothetical protein
MLMKSELMLLVIVGAFVFGVTAYAHHSFTATYDVNRTIKIEGKLVQLQFRNPHSFIQLMAPDENGVMHKWSVEWGAAGQLGTQGVRPDSLKPGDQLIITGEPGRNSSEHRVRMRTLHRPLDGFGWGTRPTETFD